MYKKIQKHPNVRDIYKQQLLDEGVLTPETEKQMRDHVKNRMMDAYNKSKTEEVDYEKWKSQPWEEMKKWTHEDGEYRITGQETDYLQELGAEISTIPSQFKAHRQI